MGEAIRKGALPEGAPTLDGLQASVEGAPRRRVLFCQMYAELHAYLGDTEGTLEGLHCASGAGLIDVFWMDRCPLFDPLRGDARFAAARMPVARRADEILDAYRAP
jgi:serine/threonine-protein kinase